MEKESKRAENAICDLEMGSSFGIKRTERMFMPDKEF